MRWVLSSAFLSHIQKPHLFFCTYAISGNCGSSGGGKGGGEQEVTVLLFNEKFGRMNNRVGIF